MLLENIDDAVYSVASRDSLFLSSDPGSVATLVAANDASLPNTFDACSSIVPGNLILSVALIDSALTDAIGVSAMSIASNDMAFPVAPGDAALFKIFADSLPSVECNNAVSSVVAGDFMPLVAPSDFMFPDTTGNSARSIAFRVVKVLVATIVDCGRSVTSGNTELLFINDIALPCFVRDKDKLPEESNDVNTSVDTNNAVRSELNADAVFSDVFDEGVDSVVLGETMLSVLVAENVLLKISGDAACLITSDNSILPDVSSSAITTVALNNSAFGDIAVNAAPSVVSGDLTTLMAFGDVRLFDTPTETVLSFANGNDGVSAAAGDAVPLVAPNNSVLSDAISDSASWLEYNVVVLLIAAFDVFLEAFEGCGRLVTLGKAILPAIDDNAPL